VSPSDPSPGVVDLLKEALALYRTHARAFLVTAAVLFVPGSLASSCALSLTLAPLTKQAAALEDVGQRVTERSQALARRMSEQAKRKSVDPKALEEFARDYERNWSEMGRAGMEVAGLFKRGLMALILGLLGWALIALILYGIVLPLTQGALTLAVADRLLGGNAGWREHWALLVRRKGRLLSAIVPAALLCMVGYFFLVLPGLVISFFFSFVAPVVLVEGVSGPAALKRSFALVKLDWLRVALVLVTFGVLNAAAHALAGLMVPKGAIFFATFLGDLISLVLMPVPIILSVLLYLDIRRRTDGVTREQLAADLAALRQS
jgi:hypothetical protein